MKKKYKKLNREVESLRKDNIIMMNALDILNARIKNVVISANDIKLAQYGSAKTKRNG